MTKGKEVTGNWQWMFLKVHERESGNGKVKVIIIIIIHPITIDYATKVDLSK